MAFIRVLLAAALAAVSWDHALAQTIETPRTQSGQGSVNVGNAGQGSGTSVTSDLNKPGASSIQLKGSVEGYRAPSVRLEGSASPELGGVMLPGGVPVEEAGPGQAVVPQASRFSAPAQAPSVLKAAPQTRGVEESLPLKRVAPVSADLSETVTQVRNAAKEGGASGEVALEAALHKIFEGARQAARKSADSAELGSVAGAIMKTEGKVRQTVSVANTSSPHDAPGLYESAIETAKEALPAAAAEAVRKAVLASADRKAERALPDLANETVQAARTGSGKGVERGLRSFSSWERLLGKPGRPLVENLSHLKSFVQGILDSASAGKSGSGALASMAAAVTSPDAKPVSSRVQASGGSIWFQRDPKTRSFQAVLPGSAVRQVPDLVLSFSLASAAGSSAMETDAYAAFLAQPTAGNGARIIYRSSRDSGSGRVSSLMTAASFWARYSAAGLASGLKALLRGPVSLDQVRSLAREEASEYASAQAMLASADGSVTRVAASELLRRAGRMAFLYDRLSGDGGGAGAVRDIGRRLSESGAMLSDDAALSPAAARWITGGDGASLVDWIERIHAATTALAASRGVEGAFSGAWDGLSPSAFQGGPDAARAALERLLADVEQRRVGAEAAASVLASLDPTPSRYTDLGRVGGLLAQAMTVRLADGRTVLLTVLRDAELGRIAFARAEASGSRRSLSAKELSSGLRVD
ncbi:MAG: hypothetical protein HY924_04440 [Elusimicrobia bacterium]|nr:hypothetical protein [Elusimicrobiota bacterium]